MKEKIQKTRINFKILNKLKQILLYLKWKFDKSS